jgi:hypothetical protein
MNKIYLDTARMLVQVAPLVFRDSPFALKGGTAINLFVRDMPRLSVDLDVVFTDHRAARDAALARINDSLAAAADRLNAHRFIVRKQTTSDASDTKLHVRRGNIEVKVEVNFVLRGTVHPVRMASLTAKAREALQADVEIPVVATRTCTPENSLPRSIDSTHAISSMSCSYSQTAALRLRCVGPSSSISPATTGRFTSF